MNRMHSTLTVALFALGCGGTDPTSDVTPPTVNVTPIELEVAAASPTHDGPIAPDASTGPDAALDGGAPSTTRKGGLAAAAVTTGLSTRYSWAQGQQSVVMMNYNSGFCFLTAISGHFVGGGEYVKIDASNQYWILGGSSLQPNGSIRAEAVCIAWSWLNPNGGEDFTWDNYESAASNPNCWQNGTCSVNTYPLWHTDSFCSLMGYGGALTGTEYGYVFPSGNTWDLQVGAQVTNGAEAWAGCFHNHNYPTAIGGQHFWAQGQAGVDMGSDNNVVCGLTYVTGHFAGGGESVSIEDIGGRWTLSGTSQQSGVAAAARCTDITIIAH